MVVLGLEAKKNGAWTCSPQLYARQRVLPEATVRTLSYQTSSSALGLLSLCWLILLSGFTVGLAASGSL